MTRVSKASSTPVRITAGLLALALTVGGWIWAGPIRSKSITLQWDPPTNGVPEVYVLNQRSGSGPWAVVGSTTNTTITLPAVAPGSYAWSVTASNIWGESERSNEVGIPGPVTNAPPNLRVAAVVTVEVP